MKREFFKIKYLSNKEIVKYLSIGALYYFVLSFVFFRSFIVSIMSVVFSIYYLKKSDVKKGVTEKAKLRVQFKEAIYALTSSISGGKSIERAFISSLADLRRVYDEDALIIIYWTEIINKISINIAVEDALLDFARDSELDEIENFAQIFALSKRVGGNLVEIIKNSTCIINEKIELNNDLAVLVASKEYEQRILSFIIPAMIFFFNIFSPAFLSPLYGSLKGRFVMSLALMAYLFSTFIGERIVDIRV